MNFFLQILQFKEFCNLIGQDILGNTPEQEFSQRLGLQ